MELSLSQIAFISVTASVVVIVLRFIYEFAAKKSLTVPNWVMLVLVYLASLVLAWLWFPQTLPAYPGWGWDPTSILPFLVYLGQLLVILTAYASVAAGIYTLMLKDVKDSIGQAILPKLYPAK